MDGVESARVLIGVPANRGRLEGKQPFAVIVVEAKDTTKLNPEQVQTIQRLVAGSTDLLAPEQVVVLQSPDDRVFAEFKR